MSEVKLNLVDAERVRHGTIHGSVADGCIAALSAEPETIAELEAALTRYIKPRDDGRFFDFSSRMICEQAVRDLIDSEPWDAGLVVIDLAARIVAIDSTYSQPGPDGDVTYHDGVAGTDVSILYRVPDDWLFVNSFEAYQWSRERRVEQRPAKPPLDARPILFGPQLIQFLVNACLSVPFEILRAGSTKADDFADTQISTVHARWLLTPRDDLHGRSPRDVLLAQQDFIDFDMHTRCLQWSELHEGPPCLAESSFAYRYAGFGTHQWVIYYDLVRYLLRSLIEKLEPTKDASAEQLSTMLGKLMNDWLNNPQPELDGRIPAVLMNNERKRLPEAMRPRDMIVDDDCPMCMTLADETSPLGMGVGFWHLDGAHMDDEFAFSPYKTREEWEADRQRQEQMYQDFAREDEERRRIARAETLEFARFVDPEWDSDPS
ncbi:MAG TPA: hypothetical protein VJT50_08245 [Pyrinomonadaceae bacterium]|nr:hypothetical protein [Pyrinomonadaceae bacterium]